MRRKLHTYTGNQWDFCQRCGQLYTMRELTVQRGLLVCTPHCFDNLDNERREKIIAEKLGDAAQEGADRRQEHWSFFQTHNYEEG